MNTQGDPRVYPGTGQDRRGGKTTMITKRIAAIVAAGLAALGAMGCQTTPVQDGAIAGAALGAASGAIIGHQMGRQGEGALIGAGAGGLLGALIGDDIGRQQRRYATPGTVVPSAAPPRVYAPATQPHATRGYYKTRLVRAPSGETYEERVFVPLR